MRHWVGLSGKGVMKKEKTNPKQCVLCHGIKLNYVESRGWDDLWECCVCKGVFAWPQLKYEELEQYYDDVTDLDYFSKYKNEALRRAKVILDFLNKKRVKQEVLDVGCGAGYFLKEATDQNWRVEGIELSKKVIERTKELGEFKIHQGEIKSCLDQCPQYEVITAQHILEHIHDPLTFLKQVHEKLKPGGWLVLAVPNYDSWMRQWAGMNWVLLREQGHLLHFSSRSLASLLKRSQFQLVYQTAPQWNALDLIWAWRQKGKVFELKEKESQQQGGVQKRSHEWVRQIVDLLAQPFAWMAQYRGRGGELLAFARKQ